MPLPFFYHLGNAGGLSFVRAACMTRSAGELLTINSAVDLAAAMPRLAEADAAGLRFAFGHAVYLAEPWIAERYEITLLRWPLAVFCANAIYSHERPECTALLPAVFAIADHHARLRACLDHLERGGDNHLAPLLAWLDDRHKLGCGAWPGRAQRQALVAPCDRLLRERYRLVGITELMDESLFLLQADLPGRRIAPWVRRRENKSRVDPFDLPADIVERFEREYALDILLYQQARSRLLLRFAEFWQVRVDMREPYLDYKAAMILTDPLLMAKFAAADPLYFPPELPLEDLRARVVAQLDRAHEVRASIMRAYG